MDWYLAQAKYVRYFLYFMSFIWCEVLGSWGYHYGFMPVIGMFFFIRIFEFMVAYQEYKLKEEEKKYREKLKNEEGKSWFKLLNRLGVVMIDDVYSSRPITMRKVRFQKEYSRFIDSILANIRNN